VLKSPFFSEVTPVWTHQLDHRLIAHIAFSQLPDYAQDAVAQPRRHGSPRDPQHPGQNVQGQAPLLDQLSDGLNRDLVGRFQRIHMLGLVQQ
jgi:hypothetical protein